MNEFESGNIWKHRVSRRRWLGGAGVVGLGTASAALIGCGSQPAAEPKAATPAAKASAPAALTPQAAAKPKAGGELRVAVDNNPVSYDPHIEASYRTQWSVGGAYNRVLGLTTDLKITPELAASWETPDNTTVVLKMQQGVKFHNVAPVNGRAFTAEDVVWSIQRIATNKPEFQRRYMFDAIDKITATDANTVTIKLKTPFAPLFGYLANPFTVVAPKEALGEKGDLRTAVVGTGPFVFKSGQKGVAYKWEKNPAYWEKEMPYLDSYTLSVVPDAATRLASLRAKQLDVEVVSPDQAASLKGDNSLVIESVAQGNNFTIRYNTTRAPFNDVRVRKAFDLVIDRKQIAQLVYGGGALPAGPINPGLGAWAISQEDLAKAPGYRADKAADVAEAKKLLEAAGQTNFQFDYVYYTPAVEHEQVAQTAQQQLEKAGFKVKLTKMQYAEWIPFTLEKKFMMTGTGSGFRDNPDEYLYALFHSSSSRNDTGYKNPEIDKLLEQSRSQLKEDERKATVMDLQKRLMNEVPNSWITGGTLMEARSATLKGYVPTYTHNRPRQFVRAWFDK
ncbi:MAG: ABC transporter substrate-binding protein [Dehalococcoidia bacterium]